MTTWHPPIPAGALYSDAALALGPGLALLAWCYDHVQKGGAIEVSLEKAGRDIGKPYGTIRDWWRMLREGPFFCEQIDRGKRGWIVRMADDWLDWHVMTNNYPDTVNAEMSALTERRDVSGEDVQSSVKAASKQRQRRNVSVEPSAYKVLHDTQKSDTHGAIDRNSFFVTIAEACQIDLKLCTDRQKGQIAQTVKKLTKVGKTPEEIPKVLNYWYTNDWRGKKGDVPRPDQLIEVWQQAIAQNGHPNGKHVRSGTGQHSERKPQVEADLDKPL
jgi:hypothetical protein